ncbi:dihydrolipoyl dehydrogenase [Marinospirillum alkaliphilum]|uniref:Dihydrolipoamide dehydrogenase n=1 Tax=Marinospirillum alkaliphilum DSM 21637 TaxID=1122209 RepID=A0A1K1VGJ8_9GAMM|nr:dihydrolipoyl dehydrogenase [Marinospirillum alkaliphilum]SFX24183.1 dihydrolipoamide dehydrogenase [Marinospirillum alkaliphilum DSM 21637]
MQYQTDLAIIGAGTAGMSAYKAARKAGLQPLLIENGPLGTTCARVGCMPSKLLIAAADAAHQLQQAPELGIHPGTIQVDGTAVMQRLRKERDRFVQGVVREVEGWPDNSLLQGSVQFVSPNRLKTDRGDQIEARTILLATGTRPNIPSQLLNAGDRLLTNEQVFELPTLPRSLAVFGAGVIGLELGQAMQRLGVEVSLFARTRQLGPLQDPALQASALATFEETLDLQLGSEVKTISRTPAGVTISYLNANGQPQTKTFDYLLAATGRQSNLDRVQLEAANLLLDRRGLPVSNPLTAQCTNLDGSPSHIFIAGDAAGYRPLLHEANDEGHLAGRNAALWPKVESRPRRTPLTLVFTDPQMAIAGNSYNQLLNQPGKQQIVIGEADFSNQGRARVMQVNKGRLSVYADNNSGILLGAEMLGPAAEHLGHLLAWSIQQQLTLEQLLQQPFYHPTLEEGLRTALRSAAARIRQ